MKIFFSSVDNGYKRAMFFAKGRGSREIAHREPRPAKHFLVSYVAPDAAEELIKQKRRT